jgi:hypothetical protein
MKIFLLTWYGITDLRASLGFENTDGPIASALAAERYSDVVILGYSRPEGDSSDCAETKKAFISELASIRDAGLEKDWKTTGSFVSRFANTAAAHEHFVAWLKEKALGMGCDANIGFKSEKLRELNDTEGIYACAMRAMDEVERKQGEKRVTLYLSPGTPAMAFVWAFAALDHPGLKKRLIASSVSGKPPERIALPAEWLERHGAKQEKALDAAAGFDVTFHLFGEQRLPSLLGIRQFESKRHVFVNSRDYPAACMRQFVQTEFAELAADPWDGRAVHEAIVRYVDDLPTKARIGINLTGGTKLMFAGALSAARALGAVPFYFNSRNRWVTFLDSFRRETIKPIDSVETFLRLNGDGLELSKDIAMEGMSTDRQLLTRTLWDRRASIAKLYKKLTEYNNAFTPFRVEHEGFVFSLGKDKSATVQGHDLDLTFDNWPDFANYLSGGWFEEYVYSHCKPYEDAGVIKDLRVNVKLNLKQECTSGQPNRGAEYNELDLAFTDGYSLYIVECKAGNTTQEQVMKLQNLVRFYGGVEGRGILACCFPPGAKPVRKKIEDAKLTLWCGNIFPEQVKTLMDSIAARAQSTGATA